MLKKNQNIKTDFLLVIHKGVLKYQTLLFIIYSCSYKFTMDELYPLMESVKLRSESYKEWLSSVQDIVENKGTKKKGAKDKKKKAQNPILRF